MGGYRMLLCLLVGTNVMASQQDLKGDRAAEQLAVRFSTRFTSVDPQNEHSIEDAESLIDLAKAIKWSHSKALLKLEQLKRKKDFNPDAIDENGDTGLHILFRDCWERIPEAFISLVGDEINRQGSGSLTPLEIVADSGNACLLTWIMAHNNFNANYEDQAKDALYAAAARGHAVTTFALLQSDTYDPSVEDLQGVLRAVDTREHAHVKFKKTATLLEDAIQRSQGNNEVESPSSSSKASSSSDPSSSDEELADLSTGSGRRLNVSRSESDDCIIL